MILKFLMLLLTHAIIASAFFTSGYELGFNHGKTDGELQEILQCIKDMETFKEALNGKG